VNRRRVRIADHQLVQIVEPLADQHGHDVRLQDGRIVGPAERLDDVRAERTPELNGIAARHDELGKVDDHRHLPAAAARATRDRLEVQRPEQISIDELQRGSGLAHERHRLPPTLVGAERLFEPGAPIVGAAGRAHAAAAVVVKDDVVRGEQYLVKE
jgi:hypothetical protein